MFYLTIKSKKDETGANQNLLSGGNERGPSPEWRQGMLNYRATMEKNAPKVSCIPEGEYELKKDLVNDPGTILY